MVTPWVPMNGLLETEARELAASLREGATIEDLELRATVHYRAGMGWFVALRPVEDEL